MPHAHADHMLNLSIIQHLTCICAGGPKDLFNLIQSTSKTTKDSHLTNR